MLNNGNQNTSCEFFADIVSYLYNETGEADRNKFESHLAKCSLCTDEFASISNARFSIYEWHREEFEPLASPEIVIPYVNVKARESADVTSEQPRRFWAALGGILSQATWSKAIPAFAALLIFIALAVFAFVNLGSRDVQVAGNNNPKTMKEPTVGTKVDDSTPSQKQSDSIALIGTLDKQNNNIDANGTQNEVVNHSASTVKISDRKTVVQPNRIAKQNVNEAHREAINTIQRPGVPQKPKAPVLSKYDEVEDKSLRLSDLFEDGDSI